VFTFRACFGGSLVDVTVDTLGSDEAS